MSADEIAAISRRRFLNASAAELAGASAAGLAACSGPGATTAGADRGGQAAASRDVIDTVLEAFMTRRLVGLGKAHSLQNHHDVLDVPLRWNWHHSTKTGEGTPAAESAGTGQIVGQIWWPPAARRPAGFPIGDDSRPELHMLVLRQKRHGVLKG